MTELRAILDAIDGLAPDEAATLATLVWVEGSSYRQAGARMLILGDGRRIGAISGGCLEADLAERAAKLGAAFDPVMVTYSTGDENDVLFGVGMGCKGVIRVMLERIAAGREPAYLQFLRRAIAAESTHALATVFGCDGKTAVRIGDRLMFADENVATQGNWSAALLDGVTDACRKAITDGRPTRAAFELPDGRVQVCIEPIRPCTRLVIFGANVSARPVAALAKRLGWHVTVCDRRPASVQRENLPEADELLVATAAEAKEMLKLDRHTAAVIMTHNYADDTALLAMLLPSDAAYIGLLGSRARTKELVADLLREARISQEQLKRLYSPVGLDIGAETPDAIALSIVSEIQGVMNGRAGGSLRDSLRRIHDEAGR